MDTQDSDIEYINLLIYGSNQHSKLNLLNRLSDIEVPNRVKLENASSYVPLDFGRRQLDQSSVCIQLFSSPLPLMGRLETEIFKNHKRVGFIILIENLEIEEIQKWTFIISELIQKRHSFIVAMNERKDSSKMPTEMLHAILDLDPKIPVLTCNAKDDQRSCELVLLKCLEQLPQDKIVAKAIECVKRDIEDA